MFGKLLSASAMAAVLGAFPVLADLAGPAELPPSSYKGQQYVDSRGCVFLRAGYGGQVTWVPRVSQSRKQLCGYGPSGGKVEVAEEAPAPAPKETVVAAAPAPTKPKVVEAAPKVVEAAPEVVVKTAPKVTVATGPKVVYAPKPAPAPVVERPATATELAATGNKPVTYTGTGDPGTRSYRLACPAETPVAEHVAVSTGGFRMLCTRGDGKVEGANSPVLVATNNGNYVIGYDAHVAVGNGTIAANGASGSAYGGTVYVPAPVVTSKSTKSAKLPEGLPPPGYKLAWKDDRLNPNRGKQTVDGFLAQDEIWTRTVPAELREDSDVKRKPVTIVVRRKDGSETKHDGYVVSTKSGKKVEFANPAEAKVSKSTKAVAPEAVKPAKVKTEKGGNYLVQVGTFGVASNAEGAAGRLKGMGYPVARAKLKGGALTVVYAGPFASAADAKAALAAARGAGFSDARVVQ